MGRTLAIAGLFIRRLVRAKVFLVLMTILLLLLALFSAGVKADGSAVGRISLLVSYTLGSSAIILGVVTLWSCCGAISQEISDRSIRLVMVKPVRAIHVWSGKWLGVVLMNVVLLATVGAAVGGLVRWHTRAAAMSYDDRSAVWREVLTARSPVSPVVKDVEEEARVTAEKQARSGQIHPGLEEAAYRHNVNELKYAQFTVAPGDTRQWTVAVPGHVSPGNSVFQFKLVSSFRTRNPVNGVWTIGEGDDAVVFPVTDCISGPHHVVVPEEVVVPGKRLVLSFTNKDGEASHTAVFDYEGGIELRCRESGFAMNLVRCLCVVGGVLALIAALGITAGALLSFPVALFCAVAVMIMCLLSHAAILLGSTYEPAGHVREKGMIIGAVETAGETLMSGIEAFVAPVFAMNPVGSLSAGETVSWGIVWKACLLLGLVYPLILAIVGCSLMRRREFAA